MDGGLFLAEAEDDSWVEDLAAYAEEVDSTGTFPWEGLDVLQYEGLSALTARIEDGGEAAGLARSTAVVRSAARGCASSGFILANQLIQLHGTLAPGWPEHLRARVGRSAARFGLLIGAVGGEPARASRTAQGWSITGSNSVCPGAPGLAWLLVHGLTDEAAPRIGQFLVPAKSEGVIVAATEPLDGLRGCGSHLVRFETVVVAEDHAVALDPLAKGRGADPMEVAWRDLMLAALCTGIADAARDDVWAWLRATRRWDQPPESIEALLLANRRLIKSAAAETDAQCPPAPSETMMIRRIAVDNAVAAVRASRQAVGRDRCRLPLLNRRWRDVVTAAKLGDP